MNGYKGSQRDEESLRPHIARIDFVKFYAPATGGPEESERLNDAIDAMDDKEARQIALVALHQGARMLWLADRMEDLATGRPALNIMFYLVAVEAVAKLLGRATAEGRSRHYVREFFGRWCNDGHRSRLARAFSNTDGSWQKAVDYLYDLRCDVVHQGQYFNFHLPRPGDGHLVNNRVSVNISLAELRQVVLEGIVNGVRQALAGKI